MPDVAVLPANPACYVDPEFDRFVPAAEFDPSQVPATEVDETYRDFMQFGSQDARRLRSTSRACRTAMGSRCP